MRNELIEHYINGRYDWIVARCDAMHAGRSEWESRLVNDDARAAAMLAEGNPGGWGRYNAAIDSLYAEVAAADSEPVDLVRTENNWTGNHETDYARLKYGGKSSRIDRAPEPGTLLRFGLKSASKDPKFAQRVAEDAVPGIGREDDTVAGTGSEVLAYRIEGARRYVDVEAHSSWPGQREVLIAGEYRVVAVEEVTHMAPHMVDEVLTCREWAEREKLDVERFVSKRGEPCVRFGSNVYPESQFADVPRKRTGKKVNRPRPVVIRYVDLEEC